MRYEAIADAIHRGEADRLVPAMCRSVLAEIVDGRRQLAAVRHPLGFFCLPVQRCGTLGVCVHLWTRGLTQMISSTSAVHSHSWDLVSFVLYGEVGNAVMRVQDDPVGGTHRIFEVHSRGDVDEMRATSRLVRYMECDREMFGASHTYRLRAGEFHESVMAGEPEAATVVLGRSGTTADLSLGPVDRPTHHVVRQRCGPDESARAARIVMDRLANAGSGEKVW